MKLFSNFDTHLKAKAIEDSVQEYWEENVMCLSRSSLYFSVKVLWPLIQILILDVVLTWLFYYIFDYSYLWLIIWVAFVLNLPFFFYLIGKYIDYKMDFVIVNPEALIEYNQTWVFMKKVITINEKSIKSVTVERKGFLYSIFDNWDLVFFSEWDEMHGDVTLSYVKNPEEKRTQIEKIMHK